MKIGITGGIGSGKSYVCDIISQLGYPVYNCDKEAKRLMVNNPTIITELKNLIGKNAYTNQNTLNKTIIANYLFANEENASKINKIVHPVVKQDFMQWAEKQSTEFVFMESAILFESKFDETVDFSITICAPIEVRIQRTIKRDNTTQEQVEARINQQMSDDKRRAMADFHIDNGEGANPEKQIKQIISLLSSAKQS
jgi:dephospho-CoA kinase